MVERILKVICAVLLVTAICMLPLESRTGKYATECLSDYPMLGITVVLDAGHGGEDGGAIGINTLVRERDINLQIVKKIKNLFESAGATAVLTREDEKALCEGKYSKLKDMQVRSDIIEKTSPYIVISIHCNSFPKSKTAKGAQTFYYPNSVEGEALAGFIQKSIKNIADSENERQIKSENFYMLRHGNSVNVMVECGFLSSPEEEKKLSDDEYQSLLAYSVFDGTSKYLASLRKIE